MAILAISRAKTDIPISENPQEGGGETLAETSIQLIQHAIKTRLVPGLAGSMQLATATNSYKELYRIYDQNGRLPLLNSNLTKALAAAQARLNQHELEATRAELEIRTSSEISSVAARIKLGAERIDEDESDLPPLPDFEKLAPSNIATWEQGIQETISLGDPDVDLYIVSHILISNFWVKRQAAMDWVNQLIKYGNDDVRLLIAKELLPKESWAKKKGTVGALKKLIKSTNNEEVAFAIANDCLAKEHWGAKKEASGLVSLYINEFSEKVPDALGLVFYSLLTQEIWSSKPEVESWVNLAIASNNLRALKGILFWLKNQENWSTNPTGAQWIEAIILSQEDLGLAEGLLALYSFDHWREHSDSITWLRTLSESNNRAILHKIRSFGIFGIEPRKFGARANEVQNILTKVDRELGIQKSIFDQWTSFWKL